MKEIKPLLKLEAVFTRLFARRVTAESLRLFPPFAKQVGVSYLALFVLAVIGLGSAQLYCPSASLNDRTYVVFVMLLSFSYTTRAISFGLRKARTHVMSKHPLGYGAHPGQITFVPSLAVLSGFLMFSLLPPIVIFRFQHLRWAEDFCLRGVLLSFIGVIVLAVLTVTSSRFRDWLPGFIKRLPRIDSAGVAGVIYQHENTAKS